MNRSPVYLSPAGLVPLSADDKRLVDSQKLTRSRVKICIKHTFLFRREGVGHHTKISDRLVNGTLNPELATPLGDVLR